MPLLSILFTLLPAATVSASPDDTIGEIRIERLPVFPETTGTGLHWILRLANRFHRTTDEGVIRREILIQEGTPFDSLRLSESERLLRRRGIFESARIRSAPSDSSRSVSVRTQDLWSLAILLSFDKQAELTSVTFGLEESNFLGTGNEIRWIQLVSSDQDGLLAAALIPRFGRSRATGSFYYTDLDDARIRSAFLGRLPETAFDRTAWSVTGRDERSRQRFYSGGEESGSSRYELQNFDLAVGRYRGRDLQIGYGIGWAERRMKPRGEPVSILQGAPPPPAFPSRRHGGPLLYAGVTRRRFERARNIDRYGTTEDLPLGWLLQVTAGPNLRYDEDSTRAFATRGVLAASIRPVDRLLLTLEAAGSLFLRHDRSPSERSVRATGVIAWQPDRRLLSLLQTSVLAGADRPATSVVYLGTGNGTRGYPAREFEARDYLVTTFEQRFWTGLEILWTGIGANLFVDAGLPTRGRWAGDDRWRTGLGCGLLLGLRKSLRHPVRIELAWRTDEEADPTLTVSMNSSLRIVPEFVFPLPTFRFAETAR